MNKMVNLADKKNSVTIRVSDKEFTIVRVVVACRELYGKYLMMAGNYYEEVANTNEIAESDDLDKMQKQQQKLEKMILDFAKEKAQLIDDMMGLLLEKNGYSYDVKWWDENADYNDREFFIIEAMKKDECDEKKKVVEVAES